MRRPLWLLLIASALAVPAAATEVAMLDSVAIAPPSDRVDAYYFHREFRCENCLKFESYSGEAIREAFADELADGRLTWSVVNLDDGNEAYLETFDLYQASLVVADVRSDTLAGFRVLESIWDLVSAKGLFKSYVEEEVRAALDDAAELRGGAGDSSRVCP